MSLAMLLAFDSLDATLEFENWRTMGSLELDGANVFFETEGLTGDWVTLVNGHTRDSGDFKLFSKRLVEAGYRVLRFDNRGSGQSRSRELFHFRDLSNDIVSLWNHLEIKSSHLLGISMGGQIAQLVALEHPSQVRSLVLVSTCSKLKYIRSTKPWGSDVLSIVENFRPYLSEGFFERNKLLIQAMAKQVLKKIDNGDFKKGAESQKSAIEDLDQYCGDRIKNITCPTLVVHGAEDQIIIPRAVDFLKECITGSAAILYSGVGHLILAECPNRLYDDVIEFLDGLAK